MVWNTSSETTLTCSSVEMHEKKKKKTLALNSLTALIGFPAIKLDTARLVSMWARADCILIFLLNKCHCSRDFKFTRVFKKPAPISCQDLRTANLPQPSKSKTSISASDLDWSSTRCSTLSCDVSAAFSLPF